MESNNVINIIRLKIIRSKYILVIKWEFIVMYDKVVKWGMVEILVIDIFILFLRYISDILMRCWVNIVSGKS